MKSSALPQLVAVRLLDLDERVNELIARAEKADKAVEYARAVINNKIEVPKEEFEQQRAGFNVVYATADTARQQADNGRTILLECRKFIEQLPHNTKLLVVQPAAADQDLVTLQARLKALREELHKLHNITVPADDIAEKVEHYVQSLASKAAPLLRGYGQNQKLEILWPGGPDTNPMNGNGYSTIDGNALLFWALCSRRRPP